MLDEPLSLISTTLRRCLTGLKTQLTTLTLPQYVLDINMTAEAPLDLNGFHNPEAGITGLVQIPALGWQNS